MPDFKLPSLGEDIQDADVLKILVSEGDTVTAARYSSDAETPGMIRTMTNDPELQARCDTWTT